MQTRLSSFYEALMNVGIGYWVAVISNYFILPYFPPPITLEVSAIIGFWFTLIALIRSYIIRRWFNARIHKTALRMAGEK